MSKPPELMIDVMLKGSMLVMAAPELSDPIINAGHFPNTSKKQPRTNFPVSLEIPLQLSEPQIRCV